MNNSKNYILYIVIGILVCGVIYLYNQNNNLESELSLKNNQLNQVNTELMQSNLELSTTKNELSLKNITLQETEAELSIINNKLEQKGVALVEKEKELLATKNELESSKQEIISLNDDLVNIANQLLTKNNTIGELNTEILDYKEVLSGFNIILKTSESCSDVELIDNPNATNTTISKLMVFLKSDITEYNTYITNVYDCSQFSKDIHNNAEALGIKCAVIHLSFSNSYFNHAINAFLTTDYGWVFVDCTEEPDKIVYIKSEREYRAVDVENININRLNDITWWDSLYTYYYIQAQSSPTSFYIGIVESIVDDIIIYW